MDLAYFTMPLHPETRPFVETLRELVGVSINDQVVRETTSTL